MTEVRAIEALDLLAYADGLLDPARRAEVEALLRRDPEAAARVADYVAQNQAIRAAYGSIAAEPVPPRLLAVLERSASSAPLWRRPLRLAAFAASLAAAGFLGWMANAPGGGRAAQPSDALVEASFALHGEWSPRPEAAVGDAGAPLLLPKPLAAEEGELALRLPLPDLTTLGLQLLGLRATESRGLAGVQLIYGDGRGERVSLFLVPAAGGGAPAETRRSQGEAELVYWRDGPIAFALVGEAAGRSAAQVAAKVRGSLRAAPLLLPPASRGLAAGNGDPASGGLESVPLLRPLPATGEGAAGAM